MNQYEPIDNDSDCVEFEVDRIEQMVVEFEECCLCRGEGMVAIGGWWYTCRRCEGTGEIERK